MLPKRVSKVREKRRKRLIGRIILVLILLLVLIALPATLSHLSFWRIENIVISGNESVSSDSVKEKVKEKISGSYWYLFPKDNILLYPSRKIKKSLVEEFSRISEVSTKMTGFKEITITVSERKPYGLWCNEQEECFFLNANGFIFDKAPAFSDNVFFVFKGQIEGDPLLKFFAPTEDFTVIRLVLENLSRFDLKPKLVKSLAFKEYAILLQTGEEILITTSQSAEETLSNLDSVLSDPNLAIREGEELLVWNLDLRYGNKVFFTRKGE